MARVVLVTGANSGIGRATVRSLLSRGATVVATVRSDDAAQSVEELRLSGAATDQLRIDRLDVTDHATATEVVARHRPDVVVNNAGAALLGAVVEVDEDAARAQLEAMVLGPMHLARQLAELPGDPAGRRIVNVSSTLAEAPLPFTGWYAAAKAALDSLSDCLRVELAPARIDVVVVRCGAVATSVWETAGASLAEGGEPETASARRRWAQMTGAVSRWFADPDAVGAAIAAAAWSRNAAPVVRVGFGSRASGLAPVVPTRVRDLALRVGFALS